MRWQSGRRSENVEDRRGMRVGRPVAFGGGGLILLMLVAVMCGVDPTELLRVISTEGGPLTQEVEQPGSLPQQGGVPDEPSEFVRVVLGYTEDTWQQLFLQNGRQYQNPTLVLFTDYVESACGMASAAVGPFYCPADGQVYIDLGFYRDLKERFAAPGDFAQAYVIAHEVGHHVQNLLGISGKVHRAQQSLGGEQANALSVRLELQADCLAGVWAHHADARERFLEGGDVEEGLNAAAAIGDDRIQSMSRGQVSPETWTHGSSEQRVRWFRTGLHSGRMEDCDTFAVSSL
jgi:predicted metalloprotease